MNRMVARTGFRIPFPPFVQWFVHEAFAVAFVSYLGFAVIDGLVPGFISSQLSMNSLLWSLLILGLIDVGSGSVEGRAPSPSTPRQRLGRVILAGGLAVAAGGIIWIKTLALGDLRLVVSILVGLVVLGLGLSFQLEDDPSDFNAGGGLKGDTG